jgi:hypothetical protein
MPPIPPGPEPPEGAVPFIIPAGGVPEGAVPFIPAMAVLFIVAMEVTEGVPAAACSFPFTDAYGVPDDDDVVVELCVQPAIRIPAMRSADPISISILFFFMECITWTVRSHRRPFSSAPPP